MRLSDAGLRRNPNEAALCLIIDPSPLAQRRLRPRDRSNRLLEGEVYRSNSRRIEEPPSGSEASVRPLTCLLTLNMDQIV